MRLLDNFLGRFGYAKKSRNRGFNAAIPNRLTADWPIINLSIDEDLRRGLGPLRARGRDLQENNEYFQKYLSLLKTNVVGKDGVTLKNKAIESYTLDKKSGKAITVYDTLANKQ